MFQSLSFRGCLGEAAVGVPVLGVEIVTGILSWKAFVQNEMMGKSLVQYCPHSIIFLVNHKLFF